MEKTPQHKYKNARVLNGLDIGWLIEQKVFDHSKAVWHPYPESKWTGLTHRFEWFPILMITHKKNGDVKVRTTRGGDATYSGTTEIHLKEPE
jgi:hypothetical protein